MERLVEVAVSQFGRLDGALNNAGGYMPPRRCPASMPATGTGTWNRT